MSLPRGKIRLWRLVSLIGQYQLGRLVSPFGQTQLQRSVFLFKKNQLGRLESLYNKTQFQRLVYLLGINQLGRLVTQGYGDSIGKGPPTNSVSRFTNKFLKNLPQLCYGPFNLNPGFLLERLKHFLCNSFVGMSVRALRRADLSHNKAVESQSGTLYGINSS